MKFSEKSDKTQIFKRRLQKLKEEDDFIFDGKSKQESLESGMIEIEKFLDESNEDHKVKDQKSSLSSFKLDNQPNFKN